MTGARSPYRVRFGAPGVWRSLVARSVRVGEAPSSNLGTPITGEPTKVPPCRSCGAGELSLGSVPRATERPVATASILLYAGSVLRAVVFDVDFTLARPGPDLGPEGYRELGLRYGLELDPARATRRRARPRSPRSSVIPSSTTTRRSGCSSPSGSSSGWAGGATPTAPRSRWSGAGSHSQHFELYDDARAGARGAPRPTGSEDRTALELLARPDDFVAHHGLVADAVLTSHAHGKTKPHESIFLAVLALLDVPPGEAAMVGDTLHDDVEGALAVGMRAVLLDRDGRHPEVRPALARPARAAGGARARIGLRACAARTSSRPSSTTPRIARDTGGARPVSAGRSAAPRWAARSTSFPTASGPIRSTSTTGSRSGCVVVAGDADPARRRTASGC